MKGLIINYFLCVVISNFQEGIYIRPYQWHSGYVMDAHTTTNQWISNS